jgi:hypothetical protein
VSTVALERHEVLMEVVRHRITNRAFAPFEVPRQHVEVDEQALSRDESRVD